MSDKNQTVKVLLDLLIGAEEASQDFYFQLAKMFAHEPVAEAVWWKMAADETFHIWLLEQIKRSLSPEELLAPAPSQIWEQVQESLTAISPEAALKDIHTLEDAYQAAHELEHYEFGAILDFLFSEYIQADYQQAFIRSQLRDHVARLEELRMPEWRQIVQAMNPHAATE